MPAATAAATALRGTAAATELSMVARDDVASSLACEAPVTANSAANQVLAEGWAVDENEDQASAALPMVACTRCLLTLAGGIRPRRLPSPTGPLLRCCNTWGVLGSRCSSGYGGCGLGCGRRAGFESGAASRWAGWAWPALLRLHRSALVGSGPAPWWPVAADDVGAALLGGMLWLQRWSSTRSNDGYVA